MQLILHVNIVSIIYVPPCLSKPMIPLIKLQVFTFPNHCLRASPPDSEQVTPFPCNQ